jgi:hypothetical protein
VCGVFIGEVVEEVVAWVFAVVDALLFLCALLVFVAK